MNASEYQTYAAERRAGVYDDDDDIETCEDCGIEVGYCTCP